MSRNRNRNIKNKFIVSSAASHKSQQGNLTADSGIEINQSGLIKKSDKYLVKDIWETGSSISTIGSVDVNILDEDDDDDIKTFGRDDSFETNSSISWAEEYENKKTNLVKEEYERMERVLQCLEPIPPHYDKEEYKLWIKTFPCLSLTSQTTSGAPARSSGTKLFQKQDDLPIRKNCDKPNSPSSTVATIQSSESLKDELSVIDKLIDDLYLSKKQHSTTFSSSKDLAINNTINPRTLNVKVDSFLQIAPVSLPKKLDDDLKQVVNSRTENWLETLETHNSKSLPHTAKQKRKKSSFFSHNYKANSDFIILPPIENDMNQFRSISAISNRTFTRQRNANSLLKPTLFESEGECDNSIQKLDRFIKFDNK